MDRSFGYGPRMAGSALAWALEAGNKRAVIMLSSVRRTLEPPQPTILGSLVDLITWHTAVTPPGGDRSTTSSPGDELAFASLGGRLDVCRKLLREGANPCSHGATALHWACERGHVAVVRLLLEDARLGAVGGGRAGGAAVSEALVTACAAGQEDIVRELLADPQLRFDVRLPLSCMDVRSGWVWREEPGDRESAVWEPIWSDEALDLLPGLVDMTPESGDEGGEPNQRLRDVSSSVCALGIAARIGDCNIVDALLEHQRVRTANGDLAVILACLAGHAAVADSILDSFYLSARRSVVRAAMDPATRHAVFLASCICGCPALVRRVVEELGPELDLDVAMAVDWGFPTLGRAGVRAALVRGYFEVVLYLVPDHVDDFEVDEGWPDTALDKAFVLFQQQRRC